MKVYIDGVLRVDANDPYSTFNNNDNDLILGWSEEINAYFSPFKGRLDELRIYNRALTEDEIASLFSADAPTAQPVEIIEESTFDTGLEGWTGDPRCFNWASSGGNPGGFASFDKWISCSPLTVSAPDKFLGDWSALDRAGAIVFDQAIFRGPCCLSARNRTITISGPGGSATWWGPVAPLNCPGDPACGWTTFEVPLAQSAWVVNSGTWQELLSDITSVGILQDLHQAFHPVSALDNVRLVGPAEAFIGGNVKIDPSYSFTLAQGTSITVPVRLINSSEEQRSATLVAKNPHSSLAVFRESPDPIDVAPGETVNVPIQIDASSPFVEVGAYEGILLEVSVNDGSTLYSNITVHVTEPEEPQRPDLTLKAEDISIISADGEESATYAATICNRGDASASQVEVQFDDFGDRVGNTVVSEIPANVCRTASLTVPESPLGDRLVTVVVDPYEKIVELDKNNNSGSKLVRRGGGSSATGHILVTGSASPGAVCPRSLVSITGHAVYDIRIDGVEYTNYVVKGGSVQVTADWDSIYGDIHTNVAGNVSRFVLAPDSPGRHSVRLTVTDTTFSGQGTIYFTVVPAEDCVAGEPLPIGPPIGPGPGLGSWDLIVGPGGLWEWICSGDDCPPMPSQDVFVYSEDIVFSTNHPRPNDDVMIGARIQHFATRTGLSSGEVNVAIHIYQPGGATTTLPPIVIDDIAAGNTSPVFANWKPPADGIYIVEVAVDPVELVEDPLNNAATRAIFVGRSVDPNDKIGPLGEGVERLVSGEEPLDYTVLFENLETATVPAQDVVISDRLDTSAIDVSTLSLGPIAFGETVVVPPDGVSTYSTDVDLRPDKDLIVRIEADFDPGTGLLVWRFGSIDPETGEPISDPDAGFLPPNINSPEGSGSVRFTVMPREGLPPGTETCNQAEIVFDKNPANVTPYWCNMLDTVSDSETPVADPGGPYTGDEDVPILFDGSGSYDPDGGAITAYDWDFGDGATGISVAPSHTYADSGTYTVTLTVIDDEGATSPPATQTVTVNPVNDAPVAADDAATTDEDTPVTIAVLDNDSDVDGDTLSVTEVGSPFDGTASSDGTGVTYTPNPNFNGTDSFTYTVEDGNGGSDIATVTVTVSPVNDAPIAVDDAATTDEDVPVTIAVLDNDSDVDGDSLSVTEVGSPTNGTASSDGTRVTYTPNPNFNGTDSFTYTIEDGNGGSDIATVTVTVNAVNDAPIAADDAATTDEDMPVTIAVLDNDSDVDGDSLSVTEVGSPTNGTASSGGTWVTYTPNPNFNGADTFTYTVEDSNGGMDIATVTVTVSPVNDAPIAVDDAATTDEDVPVTIAVLANDSDVDGDSLSIMSVSPATDGTVGIDGDEVSYTPNPNFNGEDSFTYTISDGNGGTDIATVTVTVTPVNDPPDVRVDLASQDVQYSDRITEVTILADDIDSPSLILTTTALPASLATTGGCTPADAGASCTWTLSGQALIGAGAYPISFEVSDGFAIASASTEVIVTQEDAKVVFDDANPVAARVSDPGGDIPELTLSFNVKEASPDTAAAGAFPGDIQLAEVFASLVPVGPGGQVEPRSCAITSDGDGYDAVLTLSCAFENVPVSTYTVSVTVTGSYYVGSGEDTFTVYDPSLGFATGGGWFYWPGTEDKTNFGFTTKYNKKGTNLQGSFLLIRHLADGSMFRVKSNALEGLALGEDRKVPLGWASFSGKATYLEPGWPEPIGNYDFTVYVEDHDEPGTGIDRFWTSVVDKDGNPTPLSLDEPAGLHAESLSGGNIAVPHRQ